MNHFWGITIATVLALFDAASARAMPKVGDYAKYSVSVQTGRTTALHTFERKIVSYNAATQMFTVRETITPQGQPAQTEDLNLSADELMSDQQVTEMLQACAQIPGGTKENITVPAGTFPSCKIADEGGETVWMAKVAFGIVKSITSGEDGTSTMILQAQTIAP